MKFLKLKNNLFLQKYFYRINHMLKFLAAFVSIFLIGIICLQLPQENVGLASFANKSNLLGSPSSTQRFLNLLTVLGILVYFAIAFQLNLITS